MENIIKVLSDAGISFFAIAALIVIIFKQLQLFEKMESLQQQRHEEAQKTFQELRNSIGENTLATSELIDAVCSSKCPIMNKDE